MLCYCSIVTNKSPIPITFYAISGTALYSIYSKGNHACIPDIENRALTSIKGGISTKEELEVESSYERVGTNVFAAHDMKKGDEVHTCYLHGGSGEHISKKERTSQLTQYLFKCDCQLCQSQQESESSGDY